MKRYWKLVILSLIIILSFGTFYIKVALSHDGLPHFVIQKQSGDEAAIKSVVLDGSYDRGQTGHQLKITEEGTYYYSSNLNALLMKREVPKKIIQLQQKYRNFMRGKDDSLNNYYEDNQILAYAYEGTHGNIQTGNGLEHAFKLQVSFLDKTKSKAAVNLTFHIKSKDFYMDVEEVQRVGNQLDILSDNGGPQGQSIHVYSVDLNTKKLIRDRQIIRTTSSNMSILSNHDSIDPDHFVAIEDYNSETGNLSEIYSLNLVSMKKTKLNIPQNIIMNANLVSSYGPTLYFINSNESQIISFNTRTQKVKNHINVDQPDGDAQISNKKQQRLFIAGNHLYLLSPYNPSTNRGTLNIVDLRTGKSLFKGVIKEKNPKKTTKGDSLNIFDLKA